MIFSQTQLEAINTFNRMVDCGELSFEKMDCLCGSSDSVETSNKDFYGLSIRIVICKNCSLMRCDPRLTDQSYDLFYSLDLYRKLDTGIDFLESADQNLIGSESKYLFDQFSPFFNGKLNLEVLEFGCGAGWNLIHFANAGHRVTGYDYSPALTQKGKSYGMDLRVGTYGDVEGEYDAIILNHVMEHFTDLPGSMSSLISHLKPEGLLYIGVPNIEFYNKKQLQCAHVFYFTLPTFEYYMGQYGLRQVHHGATNPDEMHGIFERGAKKGSLKSLDGEYKRMLKIIRNEKIKRYTVSILDKLGLKEPIKKALGK